MIFNLFALLKIKDSRLVSALNPAYKLPDRKKISKTPIPALFEQTLLKTNQIVEKMTKCCLTTECWTSIKNANFMGITIHFMDDEYKLYTCVSDCFNFPESHTSENMAKN